MEERVVIKSMKDHQNLKKLAKAFFKRNPSISCPAFPNEAIVFNSKGLSHLFYKGAEKISRRELQESEVRINLLPRALEVLQRMPLPQEESELVDTRGKHYRYWAFEAVVDNRRVKVIVRQVGDGKKHFWSVIPAWRKNRGGVLNARGNLANQ